MRIRQEIAKMCTYVNANFLPIKVKTTMKIKQN